MCDSTGAGDGHFDLRSATLEQALEGADAAAILTAHPALDVERILATAPLAVDFRGVTRGIEAPNLVRLSVGFADGTGRGVTVTAASSMAERELGPLPPSG